MSPSSADVVIVGSGIVGSACAYYLATSAGVAGERVVVVERDPSYRDSSTARSAGGLRQQFSTPENIEMSLVTLDLIRRLREVFGPEADVAFREQGYLILASADGRHVLERNLAVQKRMKTGIALFEAAELVRRFPWLSSDGVVAGSFGLTGEGWLDPVSLMTLFRKAAQAAGVRFITGVVERVSVGRKVDSVTLGNGEVIACASFVNAAGPAAGRVAALAGIELPVEPRKRFVYVLDCREAPESLHAAPLIVDASGVWCRPEGRFFLCGRSPEAHDEPPADNLDDIDHAFFEENVWPVLATRVPAFEAVKVVNAWAGFYDYNTLDQNAVIGAHPRITNFYFANGFSGHGLQQAAAAGRAISELIVHGRYTTIDLARLGYERIARREPLFELNVI